MDPIFGHDVEQGGRRIALPEHIVEYHRVDTVPKLAVTEPTLVSLTVHHAFPMARTRAILPSFPCAPARSAGGVACPPS